MAKDSVVDGQEVNELFIIFLCFSPSAGVLSSDVVLLWKAAVHYPPRRCILQLPEQVWGGEGKSNKEMKGNRKNG